MLDREWTGRYAVFVVEGDTVMEIPDQVGNDGDLVGNDGGLALDDDTRHGRLDRPSDEVRYGVPKVGDCLFEPGKALAKAGAFDLPCRYGLTKLGVHTHLYTGEVVPKELVYLGKWFEVVEVLPLNNRTMKEAGKRWPQAEVTARNIPMTSELLRKKIGCASGRDIHLFGVRVDAAENAGNYLIVTKKRYGTD